MGGVAGVCGRPQPGEYHKGPGGVSDMRTLNTLHTSHFTLHTTSVFQKEVIARNSILCCVLCCVVCCVVLRCLVLCCVLCCVALCCVLCCVALRCVVCCVVLCRRDQIDKYLPQQWINTRTPAEWERIIFELHQRLSGYCTTHSPRNSPTARVLLFIDVCLPTLCVCVMCHVVRVCVCVG